MFSDQYNAAVKEMELEEISKDDMKINCCPNCDTDDAYVAARAFYVICRQCHMTGPVGHSDEEAVQKWNGLPRRGKYQYCEKCGEKLDPDYYHYCLEEADDEIIHILPAVLPEPQPTGKGGEE